MFGSQRFQHVESQLRSAADSMSGSENQAGMRMTRYCLENLARLLRGKGSISFEQSGSVPQRNVQCSNGLRNVVQWNIPIDPRNFMGL